MLTGDPRAQVTKGYAGHGGGTLFAVTDLDSALLAIEVIVEQGEGTHTSALAPVGVDSTTRPTHLKLEPFGFQGAPERAHYWRFLDIVEGRTRSAPCIRCGSTRRQVICPTASSAIYHGCSIPVTRSRWT